MKRSPNANSNLAPPPPREIHSFASGDAGVDNPPAKRVWQRPRIREMAIAAGTRGGPMDSNAFEGSTYNLNDLDCGRYPTVCAGYGLS